MVSSFPIREDLPNLFENYLNCTEERNLKTEIVDLCYQTNNTYSKTMQQIAVYS